MEFSRCRHLFSGILSFSSFLSICFIFLYAGTITGQENLRAGMARVNITPEIPIRMSGYAGRTNPFTGVHDSIYATAITFQFGSARAALIGADVVGFSHTLVDEVKQRIKSSSGIDPSSVFIIAAHNHGGPVTAVYESESTPEELAYFEVLKNKMVELISEAIKKEQPARVGTGKGRCDMNVNRRARHADGGIWLGRNPAGVCDREVSIIRIDDLNGQPLGAFLNWPCHATVGGQENTQITGDWPGATASFFGQQTKTLVLVTAGASADINPIYGPNNKFNDISSIGQILSEEALRIFKDIRTVVPSDLSTIQWEIQVPGKERSTSRMPNMSVMPSSTPQNLRLGGLKIGSTVLLGISGELMTEIGLNLKEISPYKNTIIVTHCNGSNGYLCTDKAYEEGGYEPMVSRTMPGTAAMITNHFREMLDKL